MKLFRESTYGRLRQVKAVADVVGSVAWAVGALLWIVLVVTYLVSR